MGVKPSKNVDDRLFSPLHTYESEASPFKNFNKRSSQLRTALKANRRKKRSNDKTISLPTSSVISTTTQEHSRILNMPQPDTNQLLKKSTENEIANTSDSTKKTNIKPNTCNNNNVDSGSVKRSSQNQNASSSKKSRREISSSTTDSRHVSLISSNTTSDIGMYSNKSTISSDCWTTLSYDPFSRIEVNTSAFTEITDQSTISRKSFFPAIESVEHHQQQFLQPLSEFSSLSILTSLKSSPKSAYLIIHEAYHQAREQNDTDDWVKFYSALDQYIKQSPAPHPIALVYLAKCFILGLGIEKNVKFGISLLEQHSSCETIYALGKIYLDGIDDEYKDQPKAYELIKRASEFAFMNDSIICTVSDAQCTLARMFFQGEGVCQDSQKAIEYLSKSAENGNMYAQFLIGVHHERGLEVEKDIEKAKMYYRKSANSHFPDAQAALGSRLIAESNYTEGVEWLEKAVQKGNSRAHLQLGILYDKGEGVQQNNDVALLHYKVAVESNNPAAQYILGLVYYFGRLGRQKNYKEAIRLIKLSAMAGLPYAQRVFGQLYQQGNIMMTARAQSEREAVRWFRRATSGGDVAALGILGKCFELGKGVEVDLKKALAFYAKAAEANSPYVCYAHIDQARLLQKMSRHIEAYSIYKKVLSIADKVRDKKSIQTAECSVARYYLCRDIEGIEYQPALAYSMLLKVAESSSDSLAHYWLGSIYDEGIPGIVEIQHQKAFDHFVVAAEAGDSDATFLVAYMLSNYVIPEKGPSDAFPWYQKAAVKGHPMSMYSLGLCYYKGIGIGEPNLDIALEWFEKAVRYGVNDAVSYIARTCLKQATIHANTPLAESFFLKAIATLKLAAEKQDAYAQRELGKIYLTGKYVDVNYNLAVELLQKSAAKNDAEALTFLGDCYHKGVGIEKDLDIAINHYLRAAELGYPYAFSAAAELYFEINDLGQAYDYYTLASKEPRIANTDVGKTAKMMVARLSLGDLPNIRNNPSAFQKLTTSRNMISANISFEILSTLAIQDKFVQAFQPLGSCYLYGTGTEVNPTQALFWLKKSAEDHNDSIAYFHLAHLYSSKLQNTIQDTKLALSYLVKSAAMCYTEAQYRMGMVYLQGKFGIRKNECTAALWFKRAASGSHSESAWILSKMANLIDQSDLELQYQKTAASFGHVLAMRTLGQKYLEPMTNAYTQKEYLEEALKYLHMAGDANDIKSLVLLGKTYSSCTKTKLKFSTMDGCEEGESKFQSEEDEKALAVQCFMKASELGDLESTVYAAEAWYEQKQYAAALELFDKAANQGHVLAIFFRARYYIEGYAGCTFDPEKGFQELLMCANDLNCTHAYNALGQCYENGIGTTRNDHLAFQWYTRAAEATNDAEAYYRIALMYAQGKLDTIVHKDMQAHKYFDLAVNTTLENHGRSCYHLGLYYLNGIADNDAPNTFLLPPDICLSLEYFRTAVDLGVPEAMLQLALIFLKDDFSAEEKEEGLCYLRRATDMGLAEAQFELGLLYHNGEQEEQDFEAAYDLFCRSAVQKHPTATYYLGVYHQHGIFVTPDPGIALEQYELAISLFEEDETAPDRWMAEYSLARILHHDLESRARAYTLFQAAHSHAPMEFQFLLKIMIARYHLFGWGGVPVQAKEAAHALIQFSKHEKLGYLVYLDLAHCFENGIGVERSLCQAFHWYGEVIHRSNTSNRYLDKAPFTFLEEEIEENEGVAMFKLGEFYRNGLVVKPDILKADNLYHLAAKKGCIAAQDYLSYMLEETRLSN